MQWRVLTCLILLAPWSAAARGKPGIIATLGPSSNRRATIRRMVRSGLSVARINLTHAGARTARRLVSELHAATKGTGKRPLLLFDLPGGKIRTGKLDGKLRLRRGQRFDLVSGSRVETSSSRTSVNYRGLDRQLKAGDRVLLDDGAIVLQVEGTTGGGTTRTKVLKGGELRGRTGLQVQGRDLPFPSMTSQDRRKLKIAVVNGAQWIGVSMVQSEPNLFAVRRALDRLGAKGVKLVAKIESHSALRNLDRIIDASDMVMIARGDLGAAVGRRLPAVQAQIAARCRAKGKPFVAATHFMSNMLREPRPSKANVADTRRAAAQGADYIMLNETAIGPYPVATVKALARSLK